MSTRRNSRKGPALNDLGEDRLVAMISGMIRSLESREVIAGSGDDCAVLKSRVDAKGGKSRFLLFKTDCVVEGIHYLASTPPSRVGWKAMSRCLSDIAAMGGTPRHALVTIVLHGSRTAAYVRGLYLGLRNAAARFDVSIVGGETSASVSPDQAMVSIAMLGDVEKSRCILRSGGKPGHDLFVTGRLGGSLRGRHLNFVPRVDEARWLTGKKNFKPSAMMDLSDGLARDLPRLACASGCGFDLDLESVPTTRGCDTTAAVNDGEDYELLLAIPRSRAGGLELGWRKQFPRLELTRIGRLTKTSVRQTAASGGWQHFGV